MLAEAWHFGIKVYRMLAVCRLEAWGTSNYRLSLTRQSIPTLARAQASAGFRTLTMHFIAFRSLMPEGLTFACSILSGHVTSNLSNLASPCAACQTDE